MNKTLLQLGLLSLAIGGSASGVTYTTIMSGENSETFSFVNNNNGNRTTVTSVQSPFLFPTYITGGTDTLTYPSGDTGGAPEPWWFHYYTGGGCASVCTHDRTGEGIPRPEPSIGQVSDPKSSVLGFLTKAAFKKTTATTSNGALPAHIIETAYFSERKDYQGEREIGIARLIRPWTSDDVMFAYWYTNDNCGLGGGSGDNMGQPYCRTSRATNGATENPSTAWNNGNGQLLAGGYSNYAFFPYGTIPPGTTYIYQTYIFWASWDSTYKQRVDVFDSGLTTLLWGANIDTSYMGVNLGLTTSGTSGYVTVGTQRFDPSNTLSATGVELDVDYVQTVKP